MFYELKLTCNFHIEPRKFRAKHVDEIMEKIEATFVNKVLPGRGMPICVSKIDSVGDPLIFPETCGTYVTTTFRLVIFKPYDGEIIEGKVMKQDASGILVTIGDFFDDVFIPKAGIQQPCTFDVEDSNWIWNCEYTEEPCIVEDEDKIRLKVTKVNFAPPTSIKEQQTQKVDLQGALLYEQVEIQKMWITGSILVSGCGPVKWWADGESDSDSSDSEEEEE